MAEIDDRIARQMEFMTRTPEFERGYDQAMAEAAASVQAMDEKLKNAERVVRAIVLSAGGKVDVYHRDLINCDDVELMRSDNPHRAA